MDAKQLVRELESCPAFDWVIINGHPVKRYYTNEVFPDANTWEILPYGIGNLNWCLDRLTRDVR